MSRQEMNNIIEREIGKHKADGQLRCSNPLLPKETQATLTQTPKI